jgi:hypothetical protein
MMLESPDFFYVPIVDQTPRWSKTAHFSRCLLAVRTQERVVLLKNEILLLSGSSLSVCKTRCRQPNDLIINEQMCFIGFNLSR